MLKTTCAYGTLDSHREMTFLARKTDSALIQIDPCLAVIVDRRLTEPCPRGINASMSMSETLTVTA